MLVINDTHIGVQRTGGTTPTSQALLREYLRSNLQNLLRLEDESVIVNGDLFESFTVDVCELIATYEIFSEWLAGHGNRKLTLIMGNHDSSAKGDKISSFHLLGHFLEARFNTQVNVIDHKDGLVGVEGNVFAISHQLNQSLFDLEIAKAVAMDGKGSYLLLHCNIKNTFAEHSDHSLNLGDQQLGDLMRAGWTLVVGHEHQGYSLRGGRVQVVGNQFPSSVADCLGNDIKYALRITDDGVEKVLTWNSLGSFAMIDWRALDTIESESWEFIRVVGDATAEQAAEVVSAIAKLRQRSCAFVITNAVKVEGAAMVEDMAAESIENIKSFDVLAAILEQLDEREQEVVKGLLS